MKANFSAPSSVSIVVSILPAMDGHDRDRRFRRPRKRCFRRLERLGRGHLGSALLKKLDGLGAILQTVTVGIGPHGAIYDGSNIWVATDANSIAVVRGSTGTVLATLTGNGLSAPLSAAFDGTRFLVTNSTGDSVSLWKAAKFQPRSVLSRCLLPARRPALAATGSISGSSCSRQTSSPASSFQ